MTVAVKNVPDAATTRPLDHLAVASWAGVIYVAASLWAVFHGIPSLWWNLWGVVSGFTSQVVPAGASAVSVFLLLLVMLAAAGALAFGGVRLYQANPRRGLKAGVFFGFVAAVIIAELTSATGMLMQHRGAAMGAGVGVMAAIGAFLLLATGYIFSRPWFEEWLIMVDDQGWFNAASYKRSQGLRMRRATIVGILALAGCGVYTLLAHGTLRTGPGSWVIPIPYTEAVVPILPNVQFTLPMLLAAFALWGAYRVVNFPVFADFLIATEAEMNKVSWTTKRRLFQDTVVVLVTVALLTAFLFFTDMAWAWGLSKLGILQSNPTTTTITAPQEPSY